MDISRLIEPRLVVWAGYLVPAGYLFFKLFEKDVSIWIPIGMIAVGIFYFTQNFIDKAEVRQAPISQIGPQEQFMPQNDQWQYQLDEHGNYVPRRVFTPPNLQPPRPPNYPPQR